MINYVLEYIKTHDNWREELAAAPYNLAIKQDGDLVLLKYSQIDSDLSLPLVQQARGMIICLETMTCVCWPFDKFFNYSEPNAAAIDWSTASVQEKVDGSLIKLFYHHGFWRVATNGTIHAVRAIADEATGESFFSLFQKAIGTDDFFGWVRAHELDPDYTYMFELVSPLTRVVIPYEQTDIYYLGCRNNATGTEYRNGHINDSDLRRPLVFRLTSLAECTAAAAQYDWMHEGFVVCDANYNRIKVKSPAYVIAHYARTNGHVGKRHLLQVVLDNEQDEFLTYASEYADAIHDIEHKVASMQAAANAAKYIIIALPKPRSEFAKVLKTCNYPKWLESYLFAYHTAYYNQKELTFAEFTKDWPLPRWERALEETGSSPLED